MDDKIKTIGQIMLDPARYGTTATASPEPSTDDLDLTILPERLDDVTLERVKAIARSPLPPEAPATERHFNQCLRVMLAVLPKRSADEVTGELFVAAYQRKLGQYSDTAISFLADKAMERCQWFPTIHECLEILADYRRNDAAVQRMRDASRLKYEEERARENEDREWRKIGRENSWHIPQDVIDKLSPEMIRIGIGCKSLMYNADGRVVNWQPEDGEVIY